MVVHEKIAEYANHAANRFQNFLILFVIGFFIVFAGVIVLMVAAVVSGGSADFGAFIFIGPFPIVAGVGLQATWVVLFAIILAVLSILMFLILRRETKKTND
jgi:uncharacterized membrane protein